MKRIMSSVAVAVAAVAVCGWANAQEVSKTQSAEYEHLKVLEPMVGNYHGEWSNNEAGEVGEMALTISWNDPKNMLIAESKSRTLEASTKRPKSEWTPGIRQYYVWNHQENRIEHIDIQAWSGAVVVYEVAAKGDAVYSYSLLRTTGLPGGKADITMIATDRDLTAKITSIRTPDGGTLDDMEWKAQRVKK